MVALFVLSVLAEPICAAVCDLAPLCQGSVCRLSRRLAQRLNYCDLWQTQQTPGGRKFRCAAMASSWWMGLINFHFLCQRTFKRERWKTSLSSLMAPLIYSICIRINPAPPGTWKCCSNDKLPFQIYILCTDVDIYVLKCVARSRCSDLSLFWWRRDIILLPVTIVLLLSTSLAFHLTFLCIQLQLATL